MRYEMVAFDLDGTLVDSVVSTESVLNAMRRERGCPPLPPRHCGAAMSAGAAMLLRFGLSGCAGEPTRDLAEFRDRYAAAALSPDALFPGTVMLLRALRKHGVAIAVCTNKPRFLAEKVLRDTGLAAMVSVLAAGDDPGVPPKPHPAQLATVAAAMSVTRETMAFVGDSDSDLRASCAFGVDFYLALYGYNLGCEDHAACRGLFHSVDELHDMLGMQR